MGNSLAPGETIARPELCVYDRRLCLLIGPAAPGLCKVGSVPASGSRALAKANAAISTLAR